MPNTYTSDVSILPVPENVKRIVFTLIGAGGGGEHIARLNEQSSPANNGGDTTFLGMTAGGGQGGGIGAKYGGGNGGIASTGNYDFRPEALIGSSTVTLANGTGGGKNDGGESAATSFNDRFIGDGGDGTGKQVTYNFFVNHVFRNSPPWSQGQVEYSPDISIDIMNPSTQNAPCGIYTWSRYYKVNFNYTFDNNRYSAYVTSSASSTAAGGTFRGYGQIGSKTTSSLGVWWCKRKNQGSGTVNSYVRSFGLSITGDRSALLGRGGGGGAEITGVLDRPDLVERGLLDITTSLFIGVAGDQNGPPIAPFAQNGTVGRASVYMEYETRTYINVKNNENNTIIEGQTAIIEWEVTGDADWALAEPGLLSQGASNFVSEVAVTPTTTTTYFLRADGVIGGFSESEVTLIVLRSPTVRIIVPADINYGDDVSVSYEATNVETSLTLRPKFYFVDGTTLESSEYNVELETGDLVDSTAVYNLTPWGDKGPYKIEFNLDAVGYSYEESGTTNYLTQSAMEGVDVYIDQDPDVIIIPETDDAIKGENPVYSPKEQSTITLQINDIDIPVAIKADAPIQVEINDSGVYVDVEQL